MFPLRVVPNASILFKVIGALRPSLHRTKIAQPLYIAGFIGLRTKNLLYLESELAELEARQDAIDNLDSQDLEALACSASWEMLSKSTREVDRERINLIKDIRRATREYQEALLLQQACLKLPQPEKRSLKALRYWFSDAIKDGGEKIPVLEGRAASRLNDADDLVALRVSPDQDRLTKFIRQRLGVLFADQCETGTHDSIVAVSEKGISRTVAAVGATAAAILLMGAMVNLYLVTKTSTKLWLVSAYMITFALSITLLTNATRPEIFGATAAYAAVLVVFISGNIGSS